MSEAYDVKIGDYFLGRATVEIGHKDDYILDLIDSSIEKWRGVVFDGKDENGIDDCPLCKIFHPINTRGLYIVEMTKINRQPCENCPVEIYTGAAGCDNTPYGEFCVKTDVYENGIEYMVQGEIKSIRQEYITAANHMLSFLYELRFWWLTTRIIKRR
jgi:hypothetical protein